jgi:hypothetical protein
MSSRSLALQGAFSNRIACLWLATHRRGSLPSDLLQETNSMKLSANDIRRASGPEGAIVLHVRRGTMFRVNLMGSKILDLLEQRFSPAEIAERISAEFNVSLEVVQNDLGPFLQSLGTHGVIDSLVKNK